MSGEFFSLRATCNEWQKYGDDVRTASDVMQQYVEGEYVEYVEHVHGIYTSNEQLINEQATFPLHSRSEMADVCVVGTTGLHAVYVVTAQPNKHIPSRPHDQIGST